MGQTPPQTSIPTAADVLGTIGTVLWSIQMLPQIWHNWRRQETDGMPGLTFLLWAVSCALYGAYAVSQKFNIPVQVQPQICGALNLVCWTQALTYHKRWKPCEASFAGAGAVLALGGLQAILIRALKKFSSQSISWPITAIATAASVIQDVGFVPLVCELWKREGRAIGINWIFLAMDWAGGFASLMSLAVQHTFDPLGGAFFLSVVLVEMGITLSHLLWSWRTRKARKEAKAAGLSYDAYIGSSE